MDSYGKRNISTAVTVLWNIQDPSLLWSCTATLEVTSDVVRDSPRSTLLRHGTICTLTYYVIVAVVFDMNCLLPNVGFDVRDWESVVKKWCYNSIQLLDKFVICTHYLTYWYSLDISETYRQSLKKVCCSNHSSLVDYLFSPFRLTCDLPFFITTAIFSMYGVRCKAGRRRRYVESRSLVTNYLLIT